MIAVSCYTMLSRMTLEEVFEVVSKDFEAWEIVGEGVHTLTDIIEDLERLVPSFDLTLSLHAPFSDVNIGSFNRGIREEAVRQIIQAVEKAANLGMKTVTIHPGLLSPISFSSPERVLEITRESLRMVDSAAEGMDIEVGIENMPQMSVTTCRRPKDLLHVIEGTGLGICYDVGHSNTSGETYNFLPFSDKFINVHLHDNEGRRDNHLQMGRGTVDFERIMKELKGYSGTYVLETRSMEDAVNGKRLLERLLAR